MDHDASWQLHKITWIPFNFEYIWCIWHLTWHHDLRYGTMRNLRYAKKVADKQSGRSPKVVATNKSLADIMAKFCVVFLQSPFEDLTAFRVRHVLLLVSILTSNAPGQCCMHATNVLPVSMRDPLVCMLPMYYLWVWEIHLYACYRCIICELWEIHLYACYQCTISEI